MCFVWKNSKTFLRIGLRNCQQREWLRRDQGDPLNPRQNQDPASSLPGGEGHVLSAARLNSGCGWERRGSRLAEPGTRLLLPEATEGSGLWALLKGEQRGPRTQIRVSKRLQPQAQVSCCTSQPGLCPATCTLTMTFKGSFPSEAGRPDIPSGPLNK